MNGVNPIQNFTSRGTFQLVVIPAFRHELPELVCQLRRLFECGPLWTHSLYNVENDLGIWSDIVEGVQPSECFQHEHPEAVYIALGTINVEVGFWDHELWGTPSAGPAAVRSRKDHFGDKSGLTNIADEGTAVVVDQDIGLTGKEIIYLASDGGLG